MWNFAHPNHFVGDTTDESLCLLEGRIYPAAKVECQVEGCTSDLQEESRYNRRYRICDVHRKLLAIAMEGQTLRFCQQCARLQPVDMFKEDRRSCQASLALHNKR